MSAARTQSHRFSRNDLIVSAAVALIAGVIYYTTACRSLWIGDTPEFALALSSLGICHPPGYPLFTILGGAFLALFDFGRPIWTAGIFNVLVAALGMAVVYTIFRHSLDRLTSFGFALLFAFSPLLWAETVGIEIYTLNVLLIALTFLTMQSDARHRWPLMVYFFGLSLTNHPSAMSLGAALIFLFIVEHQERRLRLIPVYVLLLGIAASIYLYMLVRAPFNPATDWGDPTTISRLWAHMSLKQYSGWVGNSWSNVFHALHLYYLSVTKSFSILGLPLVIVGAILGLKTARRRTICAILVLGTSLVLAAFHQARNYEPFYLPSMLFSLILISNTVVWVVRRYSNVVVKTALGALVVVFSVIQLWHNYDEVDRSEYTLYEEYCKAMLDTAGEGILFTAGDINSFGTVYLRYAENYDTLVTVFDRSMRRSRMFDYVEQLGGFRLDDYHAARDVIFRSAPGTKYMAKNHYQNEPNWLKTEHVYFSYGILYRIGGPPDHQPPILSYPAGLDGGDLMTRQMLANLDLSQGEVELVTVPPDTAAALAAFGHALHRMDNEPRAEMLYHLGVFFRRVGFGDLAIDTYEEALTKPIMTSMEKANIRLGISNVWKDRGNDALEVKDYARAVSCYETAVQFDPDNEQLLLNLALLHLRQLNDRPGAIGYLERYLLLKPHDQQARSLYNSLK